MEVAMARRITLADILELGVSERIQLIEDAWDSISQAPEQISLTEEQKKELDCRLDAYHRNPREGAPWQEIRENIEKHKYK
jgi:putative addiction module component (TIGR02574 family)